MIVLKVSSWKLILGHLRIIFRGPRQAWQVRDGQISRWIRPYITRRNMTSQHLLASHVVGF